MLGSPTQKKNVISSTYAIIMIGRVLVCMHGLLNYFNYFCFRSVSLAKFGAPSSPYRTGLTVFYVSTWFSRCSCVDSIFTLKSCSPDAGYMQDGKDFWRAIDLNGHRRILFEPISQLLNLSIHQSVGSLYLLLLFRRNWPLSFKLFNKISPAFILPLPPLLPFSFALDCCKVLLFFFETRHY